MQGIHHAPQHIAFERQRIQHLLLLFGRSRVLFYPVERERRVTLCLRRPLVEI